MDKLIKKFPAQLLQAIEIGKNAKINTKRKAAIHNIYLAGMGGSGIGGNFTAQFIKDSCTVPFLIGKGYDVPAFVGKNTLAIASSYSGNTEETLAAVKQFVKRGAKVVVIASGGKLIALAKKKKLDFVTLPAGWSSPRACLGFSVVAQLFVLHKMNFISNKFAKEIKTAAKYLEKNQKAIRARATKIAGKLATKTPVIYTPDNLEPLAIRMRQQINENAKMLAWHHVFPEMNHNELVGWKDKRTDIAALFIRSRFEHKRTAVRIDITEKIIKKKTKTVIEIKSKGDSPIQEVFYLVNLVDWVSFYLSKKRQVDAIEIDVINHLKATLAKL